MYCGTPVINETGKHGRLVGRIGGEAAMTDCGHIPVMAGEVLDLLRPKAGETYLDATFGGGGHTRLILEAADCRVVALDCDPAAVERAAELRRRWGDRLEFHRMNFSSLTTIPETRIAGVLMDLGVSSFQLDTAGRGFSFRHDGPLDMRLDTASGEPAARFLETCDTSELVRAIRDYGEEPRWRRVVDALLAARGSGELSGTVTTAEIIRRAVGPARDRSIDPATRSFQGIRIAVNRELEVLAETLPAAASLLKPGGVLAVISFHSLEDRIVKRFFRHLCGRPEHRFDSRSVSEREVYAESLTGNRPLRPSPAEVEANPRSRSARLRAIRMIREYHTLKEDNRQ